MKKLLQGCVTLLGLVYFTNCSPKTTGAVATKKPEVLQERKPGYYTTDELDEGKLLWSGNCAKCHKLYEPTSHDRSDWEKILPKMGTKAKLTDRQVELVKAYIFKAIDG